MASEPRTRVDGGRGSSGRIIAAVDSRVVDQPGVALLFCQDLVSLTWADHSIVAPTGATGATLTRWAWGLACSPAAVQASLRLPEITRAQGRCISPILLI